jgi:mRNA-degrading endonuclease RelE of RelBE toxin-antitoxin system
MACPMMSTIVSLSRFCNLPKTRPDGVVKLKSADNEYRIRIGDYRVRYEIGDEELIILLLQCKHRKDVYKA